MINRGIAILLLLSLTRAFLEAQCMLGEVDYQEPESLMSLVELEALFAVMESVAGDIDWRILHPRPCSNDVWPGLVCEQGEDGLLHVTRLDFGYKPNPSCAANASLPPAIAKLTSLKSLFIFQCFTSSNTTLPGELRQLAPSLQKLSLKSNNALVGRIPPELSSLSNLEVLTLSQNSLEGRIPAALGKLKDLQHLDLSYNMLTGDVPKQLGNLGNLGILDLSMNLLAGIIPPSLGNLSTLRKLDLSFNFLEGSIPMELGSLAGLEFLAISDNHLAGPFPDTFSNLKNLQYLIMDRNPINAALPKYLGQLVNMTALTLSSSGYFGPIPVEFGSLANLSVLTLDHNNLTGPIPVGLAELSNLYQLNLSQNFLSGPIPFSVAFVSKLGRNLDLAGNSGLCARWALGEDGDESDVQLCRDPNDSSGYTDYVSSRGGLLLQAALVLCVVASLLCV